MEHSMMNARRSKKEGALSTEGAADIFSVTITMMLYVILYRKFNKAI